MMEIESKNKDPFSMAIVPIGISLLILLILLWSCFYIVPTGYVGVLRCFGKISLSERGPGLHFKLPFPIQSVEKVDVKLRTINYIEKKAGKKLHKEKEGVIIASPVHALDKRGLPVTVELTVQYSLRPSLAAEVMAEYGENYEAKLIHPVVREAVRDIIAQYPAEIIPTKRPEIAAKTANTITTRIAQIKDHPLMITAVQLRNIELPPAIAKKIEQVQIAKQEAERMKLLQQKAEREMKVKLIEAETKKQVQIKQAEAEKQARILRAEGEAKANALLSRSLTAVILKWRELDVQEQFAQAVKSNPNIKLFYGLGGKNMHYWVGGQK